MENDLFEIKIKGKAINVPSTRINDKTVVVTGQWIKTAAVHDEEWLEGQVVDNPDYFVKTLKARKLGVDIFAFEQKIPDTKPRYKYHVEYDNVAAIPITTFEDWWAGVSADMRKDLKRANNRGVIVKVAEFNDELVKGVVGINNDTLTRQGLHFSHFGKDLDTVRREYSSYVDRSDFIGAYYGDELIGVIKVVYVGELACFMQILSKSTHHDKRPTNAMIAKAVEISAIKGKSYLTYGKYFYGNKNKSSLIDFKHRNGFERILYPRYYIPLTFKGEIALKLKLHLGLHGMLPSGVISLLVNLRVKAFQRGLQRLGSAEKIEAPCQNDHQTKRQEDKECGLSVR